MNLLLTGLGLVAIFYIIDKQLVKVDTTLALSKREAYMMSGIMILFSFLLLCKYGLHFFYGAYLYLAFYLCLTAYTDKKRAQVFCIFNYISLLIGIVCYIYRLFHGLNRTIALPALILVMFSLFLANRFHLYADGDGEIFLVIAMFLLFSDTGTDCVFYFYMVYLLAMAIISTVHHKSIDKETKKFKTPIPFGPSIFAATMIILLIM